ncbi:autotransporter outer membrane beta-barrel domain-containing protein [Bartonella sp. B39]
MINILKKRAHLCALTTSVLFFLQGAGICTGNVSPDYYRNAARAIGIGAQGQSSSFRSAEDDSGEGLVVSRDVVKELASNASLSGEGAVVEGDSIIGNSSVRSVVDPRFGAVGSAVLAKAGVEIEVDGRDIRDVVIGVAAEAGGMVSMKGGSIRDSYMGVVAVSGARALLNETNINVRSVANLESVVEENPPRVVGLKAFGGSQIMMKSGSIVFQEGGTGVLSGYGGVVELEDVKLGVTRKKQNDDSEFPGVFFVLDDGLISFDRGTFSGSNAVALWVRGGPIIDDSLFDVIDINSDDSDEINALAEIVDGIVADEKAKFSVAISSSAIQLRGDRSYGIYFDKAESQFVDLESAQTRFPKDERHIVFLKNSTFEVTGGTAVHGNGLHGVVVLGEGSFLDGDILLEARDGSVLSVFADDSLVRGRSYFDKDSHAELFLSNGSEWHLTKGVRNDALLPRDSDSRVSYVRLTNSNIRFMLPTNEDDGYQTLRIGSMDSLNYVGGLAYEAEGDSRIYFNAKLDPDDLSGKQMSDRLLIYGDVFGKTKIHVRSEHPVQENVSRDTTKKHSIPIIQVFGSAWQDSFILEGGYVTLGKAPYKYVLNAHLTTASEISPFYSNLIVKNPESLDVWEFRLEGEPAVPGRYVAPVEIPARVAPNAQVMDIVSILYPLPEENESSEVLAPSSNETPSASNLSGSYAPVVSSQSTSIAGSETDEVLEVDAVDEDEASSTMEGVETGEFPTRGYPSVVPPARGESETPETVDSIILSALPSPVSRGPLPIISFAATSAKPTSSRPDSAQLTASGRPEGDNVASVVNDVEDSVFSGCDSIEQNGKEEPRTGYSCGDGESHIIKGQTLKASSATQHSVRANNDNTIVNLEKTTITGAGSSDRENDVDLSKLQLVSAVLAETGASIVLEKGSKVHSSMIGLEAQRGGKVTMTDGTVDALYVGALASSGSSIHLDNTNILANGPLAIAGLASDSSTIEMNSGSITSTNGVGVRSESGGHVRLDKVNIIARRKKGQSNSAEVSGRSAFLLGNSGSIDFKNGNVVTDADGLWVRDTGGIVKPNSSRRRRSAEVRSSINRANVESSTITVEGEGRYGIHFDGSEKVKPLFLDGLRGFSKPLEELALISLKETVLTVPESTAIYSNNSGGRVFLEKKTNLAGDLLLRSEGNSQVFVSVSDSNITGGVRVDQDSYAKIELSNKSEWTLTRSRYKLQGISDTYSRISCVSFEDSTIRFAVPESEGYKYQTLHIGRGVGEVYKAQGDAHLYLNTYLNKGGRLLDQKTDRILIHGDVSGKTIVHVRAVSGSPGGGTGFEGSNKGISIIQVSGKAEKDSFELDGGYVALKNSPYQYVLHAYGPGSGLEKASAAQRLVEGGGEFWDFRLENGHIDSDTPPVSSPGSKPALAPDASPVSFPGSKPALAPDASPVSFPGSKPAPAPNLHPEPGLKPFSGPTEKPHPESIVKAVVPQVPTYLLLPASVFHAGLMDISNQSKQLEMLRTASTGMLEVRENPALYLHSYGGRFRYTSNLSAREYGYGGNLDYNAVEAGILLQTIESAYSVVSFGVMGSYGKLSLQPLDVKQSQESAFDKWSVTAYGSMQHDTGFYVDGLLSYGLLKGDVFTLARGKTATLKSNPLSASLTGGRTFATGYEGLVFDPQVQVVYQHLKFDKARDVDNFDIEMGKLDQWVVRVGGRLTKNPTETGYGRTVSFYGKLHLAHDFGKKQSVHFRDAFQLGSFGSSIEAGLGFNAKLFPKFSVYGDILYQHKLNKAGFSGTSFSGGVRYKF